MNFHSGHVERAALYEEIDASGTNFAVMVPYVCGNISVLAEHAERPEGGGFFGFAPEPGTPACVLAALSATALRRKNPARSPDSGEPGQ